MNMKQYPARIVKFLAIVTLSLRLVETTCPDSEYIKPCTCDDEGLQCLKLDNDGLVRVFQAPTEYKAIRRVWIFQTNITSLPSNAFGEYIIRDLYLDLNHISFVAPGAFGEAVKTLQSLSLTRNKLDSYPFDDLIKMKKLKQFGLGHNRMTNIPAKAFPPIDTLESIDLSYNSIRHLEQNAFSQLIGLSLIDLSKNDLESLDSNSLQIHKGSSKQVQISLRGNKISKIAVNAFPEHGISNLDLARNQLTYLDENVFSPLLTKGTVIDVDGNPFSCTGCETYRWLVEFNRSHLNNLLNFVCHDDTKLEDLTIESIGCITDDMYS